MKNSYLKSSSLGEQSSVGLGGFTLKLKMKFFVNENFVGNRLKELKIV